MNRKEAKELLPIIKAFSDGETIQHLDIINDEWEDVDEFVYHGRVKSYRIKPKSKPEFESNYRPFVNREECFNEVLNHGAWLRFKNSGHISCITDINASVIIGGEWLSYEEAFKKVEFAVNKRPFGVKEV